MTGAEKRVSRQHAEEAMRSVRYALTEIGVAGQYDPSLIKYHEPLRVWYETVRSKVNESEEGGAK